MMANLFIIFNANHDRFGALSNRFQGGNPEVVHVDVDRIETPLDSTESRSRIVDKPKTPKPSDINTTYGSKKFTPITFIAATL